MQLEAMMHEPDGHDLDTELEPIAAPADLLDVYEDPYRDLGDPGA
jgi:hypothetical protein